MGTIVLDIGGTAIKSACCEDGVLHAVRETPTEASLGGRHVMDRVCEIIAGYQSDFRIDRIGISTASQVNSATGTVIYANDNIPGYTGMRIRDILENTFSLPVAVENDVNCAAIGEALFGAGRGEKEFVCLTYGTGIGGAMYIRGSLYSGSSFSAGEFGAIVTHPEDRDPGKDMYLGCYEKYASTSALVQRAILLDPSLSNGRAVFARKDEPAVQQLIHAWIMEVTYGLVTIIHMLNPSALILGGGIMEQPGLPEQIQETLYENIMPSYRHVLVRKAMLGNRAGLLGAAMLHELGY